MGMRVGREGAARSAPATRASPMGALARSVLPLGQTGGEATLVERRRQWRRRRVKRQRRGCGAARGQGSDMSTRDTYKGAARSAPSTRASPACALMRSPPPLEPTAPIRPSAVEAAAAATTAREAPRRCCRGARSQGSRMGARGACGSTSTRAPKTRASTRHALAPPSPLARPSTPLQPTRAAARRPPRRRRREKRDEDAAERRGAAAAA